jgi:hypothetical protein
MITPRAPERALRLFLAGMLAIVGVRLAVG